MDSDGSNGKRGTREHGHGRRVDAIARAPGGLGRTLRRAESYLALNHRLRRFIPENARGEIGVACIDGDCLVIAAASPARATQARLLADSLLEAARQVWPEPLARTRVIIAPGLDLET